MAITRQKRKTTLRRELFKYLTSLGSSVIIIFALYMLLTSMAIQAGWVLPANYSEQMIRQERDRLQTADSISADMLPIGSKYVVLDKKSRAPLYGNMDDAEIRLAVQLVSGQSSAYYRQKVYTLIERENDDCVLQSDLRAQFRSPYLRTHFPNYELTGNVLLVVAILLVCFIITTIFANRLRSSLGALTRITHHIQNQNLDFTEKPLGIKEFDDVAHSLIDMREALKQSLETQWKTEKTKQEQIAALAHDIKIPVTIIKGNAELLSLSEQDEEQQMYTRYILSAGDKIEQHMRMLIMMSRAENMLTLNKKAVSLEEWIGELLDDTEAYAGSRDIRVQQQIDCSKVAVYLDPQLLHRALMNIIANALDHTPDGTGMDLTIHYTGQQLTFTITDSGPGFTREALEKATELFYRGDKSRTTSGHYGMGLTFADYVIKLHQGTLQLQNDLTTKGGRVIVSLPVDSTNADHSIAD
ncbi:sensor histidine kinase [Paenibacillus wulumuqiensis]|uniref:sensor histidine kinase n=1 Tax=Paenibacillus wulumuqiensis TaxID=1567107 RepID=UPI000619C3D8|nr:HAMP domain-containing sensor histidine kinase [Paenibacillus wulumuqiensis]